MVHSYNYLFVVLGFFGGGNGLGKMDLVRYSS